MLAANCSLSHVLPRSPQHPGATAALRPQADGASLSLQSFEVRRRKARALSRQHPLTVTRAPVGRAADAAPAASSRPALPGAGHGSVGAHTLHPPRTGLHRTPAPRRSQHRPARRPQHVGTPPLWALAPCPLTRGFFCSVLLSAAANRVSRASRLGLVPSPHFFRDSSQGGITPLCFAP